MNFRKRFETQSPGFQFAPMVDIVFQLLCFFVVSQIFAQWETEIDIRLPTAKTGQAPERLPGEIIVNVLKSGEFVVNQQAMGVADLEALLGRIVKLFPGQPVLIRADRDTAYEHVITVLDLCRQSDIWNISFATSAPEETTRP
jgi:biopolymer transport protein ExbD